MRKGQCRRPLLDARGLRALRRHCITNRHDSVIDITKWAQKYFQKPLSVNTIRRTICRCQLNHRRRVLRAKEEGDLPACYQCSVQKPTSLMVWGCISAYAIGSLHVLEGTMNAERYIKVLGRNICSPPDDVYFSRTMQNLILQLLQQHGFIVEEYVCWIGLPAVQIFHL